MQTKLCHAELDSASLVQGRSRIKFGMTVVVGRYDSGMSCKTKLRHAELVSASLAQGRSRIKFGMTVVTGL